MQELSKVVRLLPEVVSCTEKEKYCQHIKNRLFLELYILNLLKEEGNAAGERFPSSILVVSAVVALNLILTLSPL